MSDNVEHPSHYNAGSIETIDGIQAALGDGFLDYCLGNVLKYVWRCRHKGKLVEDLRKAAKYLEWAIEEAEKEEAEGEVVQRAEPTVWTPKVGDKVRVARGFMNPVGEVGIVKDFCPVVNGNFSILVHEGRCTLGWFKKDDVELIEAAQ